MLGGDGLHDRRQVKGFEGGNQPRDAADRDAGLAALAEDVEAETVAAFELVGHVDRSVLVEKRLLLGREQLHGHVVDIDAGEVLRARGG